MEAVVGVLDETVANMAAQVGVRMEPTEAAEGQWVKVLQGVLVAPTTALGTCRTKAAHNAYDYFCVHPI